MAEIHNALADDNLADADKAALLHTYDDIFGVEFFKEPQKQDVPDDVVKLAEARKDARDNKDWAESDRLRDEISARGYTVKDTSDGFEISKN